MFWESDKIDPDSLLAAVGQAADAVVITDAAGNIQFVNPAFTELTGYSSEEAQGQNLRIVKSGRQPTAFYQEMWATILAGKVWQGELINRRKNGCLYTEEMRIAPVKGRQEQITGYIAIKRDVSERRAAEESRQFLAAMVESSEDAIIALSPDGTILTWNRGAEAIFGYTTAEAIGKSWYMAVTPDRIYAAKQHIDDLMHGKVFPQKHAVGLRKDGQRIHISFTSWPLRNSRGEITAVSAILRDVTRQYGAEQAQALLASIIESSDDAIYATDLDGTILSWNRGAEALLGYASEEIIGKNVVALCLPRYSDRIPRILDTIREGMAIGAYDTAFRRKDGSEADVALSVSPIKNSACEVTGASVIARDIRKRREAEKAQALLASIVECSEDGIGSVALDGSILTWNRGAEGMLGYTQDEIVGRNLSLLVLPERRARLKEILEAIGKGGFVSPYDAVLIAKDGSRVDVSFSIAATQNSAGVIVGVSGIARGIGKRLQIERKLAESEERFRSVFEQAPIGICVEDLEGHYLEANSAYCKLMGYAEEELRHMSWRDLTHPEDIAVGQDMMRRLLQSSSETIEDEKRYIHRDGHVIWARLKISLTRDSDDAARCLVAHVEDITERKRASDALRESEERYRATFEQAAVGIVHTSVEGKFLRCNARFAEIVGYAPEEIIGLSFQQITHPEDAAKSNNSFHRTEKNESVTLEKRYIRKDDSTVWVRLTSSAQRDDEGNILHHITIVEDINARKEAEDKLQEANDRMSLAVRAGSMGVWDFDIAQGCGYWDDQMFRLNGLERCGPGAPYEAWLAGLHPEDRERVNAEFMATLHGEKEYDTEFRVIWPDGSLHYIHSFGLAQRDAFGNVVRVIGTNSDITTRRVAEEKLRETADRLNLAVRAGGVGVWDFDIAHNRVVWDDQMFRLYGRTRENFGGAYETWKAGLHPEDRERADAEFRATLLGEAEFDSEFRVVWPDGSIHSIRALALVQRDSGGKVVRVTGTNWEITAKKLAEARLRESEERYRATFEQAAVGIIHVSAEGKFLECNARFAEILGYPLDEITGMTMQEVTHPEDMQGSAELLQRVHEGEGNLPSMEKRYIRKDGSVTWVRTTPSMRNDCKGHEPYHITIVEDINKRKQAEISLQKAKDRLTLATRAGGVGVWDWNIPKNQMVWDEQMFRLYGVAREKFSHAIDAWMNGLHPMDRERAVEECNRALRGEGAFDTEFRVVWSDGNVRNIRAMALIQRDALGNPLHMIGTNWDITEQKQAAKELEESNRRLSAQHALLDNERKILRAFMDNIPDLMYVKDEESRFVVANPQVARWAGVEKAEELLGKTDFDFAPCEIARGFYEDEQRVILTGQPVVDQEETVGVSSTSESRTILTTKVPIFDSQGRVTGIAGIGRDITRRKQAEDALRETNRQLEEAIVRSRILAQEAARANAAKSEFLANMSHEIRTPMNGVIGMTGLLLDTELNAEQRYFAEIVRSSGEAMLSLINDILDFSKIEAGRVELEAEEFDLRGLLDNVASMLAAQARAKGIELLVSLGDEVPTRLCGDQGRLRQILVNLAGNAVKFTKQGRVSVHVQQEECGASDCLLRFSVIDTGIGIPEDKLGLLFEKFSQVDRSTTRQYGGTGLGLAISKQLAALMGGTIGVASQPEAGSEFWFTARLAKGLQPTMTQATEEPRAAALDSGRGRLQPLANVKARILLAEDNATNREVALAILWKLGLRVDAVTDGAEAINSLAFIPYDLVLMDVRMPVMDGLEATRKIRDPHSAVLNHAVPVIAMTANVQQADRQCCIEAGMNGFVPKPISPAVLRETLKKWLCMEESTTQAEPEPLLPFPSTEGERPVFDRAGVLQRMLDDHELATMVMEVFLEDMPRQMQILRKLLQAGDAHDCGRQAHAIKGATANVGGERLRKVALEMEQAAEAGDMNAVQACMVELEAEFVLLRDAMKVEWFAEHMHPYE